MDDGRAMAERERLETDGFEYKGMWGRYDVLSCPIGREHNERQTLVPTAGAFAERDAYLAHLSGLGFRHAGDFDRGKAFFKEYGNGRVTVHVTDVDSGISTQRGGVKPVLNYLDVPRIGLFWAILESRGYGSVQDFQGMALKRAGGPLRIGISPIEEVKDDISFIDRFIKRFPGIAECIDRSLDGLEE